jgi:hypothetical protein
MSMRTNSAAPKPEDQWSRWRVTLRRARRPSVWWHLCFSIGEATSRHEVVTDGFLDRDKAVEVRDACRSMLILGTGIDDVIDFARAFVATEHGGIRRDELWSPTGRLSGFAPTFAGQPRRTR